MRFSTAFSCLALLAALAHTATAALFRPAPAKAVFQWVEDPHAADPCKEPNCYNHVKYGYNVAPMNISVETNVVCQVAERPAKLAAVMFLSVFTQPGCVVSGCTMEKVLGFIPRENCFNQFGEKKANQPDGQSVIMNVGGIYYENLPSGELYLKFEKKNYLTEKPTCTYQVRSGYKRWF
ncbi:hypothetical protein PINS_up009318 [Pythium insidiosum]|nr:hypothetical protein PINS_up009318 [Pythium insidiosum]